MTYTNKYNFPILLFFAYSISILIRYSLAYISQDNTSFIYNDAFISILSPDPALYGYYAQLLLDGLPHNSDVSMIEYVIYALVKFTPFSLDTILYYAPAYITSLIILPVYFILKMYIENKIILFFTMIISSIGYGVYSRTYLGYFDTDVLNTFFPLFIVYSMILVIKKEDYRYAMLGVVLNMMYLFWYHSSQPLVYAMNGFFILFGVLFYIKKSELYKVYILFGISIIKVAFLYKVAILALLFVGFYFVKIDYKYFLGLFVFALLAILYKIDLGQFAHHLDRYLFKSELLEKSSYSFLAPMQFVAEATSSKFSDIVKLLSGNIYIFVFSILGYIALLFKDKKALLFLPLIALGILSIEAGVRFHIYGVATLIIAYGYGVYFISSKIKYTILKNIFIILMFLYPVYETYKTIEFWNTKVARPVFNSEQVMALDMMKKQSTRKDYAVTWWDYGWPIWYYTKMNTMIDNGRHHEDNYTVAKILMSDNQTFTYNATHHFYDLYSKRKTPAIVQALKKEKDPTNLMTKLSKEEMKHKKYVDKYLVLPQQMTRLIYTIFTFANIDPKTGKKLPQKLFFEFYRQGEDKNFIYLDKNTKIDKNKAIVMQGKAKIPIKTFYHILIKNNQKLLKEINTYPNGLNLINYNVKYYLMDDYFLNTTFIQLMFFNNYDKRYFEPVYTGKSISIFKVK